MLSSVEPEELSMAIEITHVRFSGYEKNHESIVRYKWRNPADGNSGDNDKPTLVDWVDKNGEAYVGSGTQRARVGVVRPSNTQAYLRTYADSTWTNNLLSLPIF